MNPDKKTARIAGLWYLAIAVLYSFSMIWVDKAFLVPGDAQATLRNLLGSGLLFKAGFLASLAGHACFLFLVNSLYRIFQGVNKELARLMVILVVAGVSVAFLNRLNQAAVMILLGSPEYLSAFTPGQIQGAIMFFLDLHHQGEVMATLFWGLWLLPLGLLVIRSGMIPKALGVLLIGAGVCYVAEFIIHFLQPDLLSFLKGIFSAVETSAEVAFLLWLLVFGVKPGTPGIKSGPSGPQGI